MDVRRPRKIPPLKGKDPAEVARKGSGSRPLLLRRRRLLQVLLYVLQEGRKPLFQFFHRGHKGGGYVREVGVKNKLELPRQVSIPEWLKAALFSMSGPIARFRFQVKCLSGFIL